MKKNIFLLSVLAVSFSCINKIDFAPEQIAPALVMNSFIDSKAEEHRVFISISKQNSISIPDKDGLQVKFMVNGKEVEDIKQAPAKEDGKPLYIEYLARSSVKPGDKIYLEAKSGAFHAFSEAEVLQPASIANVDTSRSVRTSGKERSVMRFTADVIDRKNEKNWYFIDLVRETILLNDKEEVLFTETRSLPMNFKEDYILGTGTDDADELLSLFSFRKYHVFNDNEFKDRSHKLKFMTRLNSLYSIAIAEKYKENVKEKRIFLHIKLYSINEETFKYLKNLGAATSGVFLPSFLESAVLGQNVKGGLGFVTAMTPDVQTLSLPLKK